VDTFVAVRPTSAPANWTLQDSLTRENALAFDDADGIGKFLDRLDGLTGHGTAGRSATRRFDPDQPRGPDGKWSLTGAIRHALAEAGDVDALNQAASAEAKRITGRDTHFDFTGCDVQIGREHAEGVLRGLERFPKTKLTRVSTFGRGGAEDIGQHGDAYAVTTATHGRELGSSEIHFNAGWASQPDTYRAYLAGTHSQGWGVSADPQGVALHEFGHAVDFFTEGQASGAAGLRMRNSGGSSAAASSVSHYAATNGGELTAEAFADVMLNGDGASELSKELFGLMQTHYDEMARRARGRAVVPS